MNWLRRWGGQKGEERMNPAAELLESARQLVSKVNAKSLMVIASRGLPPEGEPRPLLVTTEETSDPSCLRLAFLPREKEKKIIHAVSCALSRGKLSEGDWVVCLVEGEGGFLDSLFLYRVRGGEPILARLETEPVLKATVDLCRELAHPGGENPIGAAFVVGEEEKVLERSRQLMLNPFEGHDINITNRHYWDLLKRYARAFDGAFVVGGNGRVLAAMRYLVVEGEVRVPQGLGTRHRAVAGITSLTGAVGVTVSGEDGMVRVFERGELVAKIHPLTGALEILRPEEVES